jgi:phage terminase Nu1 subunit (DNA packaging protein)
MWLYGHGIYSEQVPCTAYTLLDVSRFFGVAYDQVRKEWVQAGMPVQEKGVYQLHDILVWKRLRRQDGHNDEPTDLAQGDIEVMRRKRSAEALVKEEEARAKKLKNDIAEALVYDSEDVERSAAEMTARVRMRLESIPDEMEMMFPRECRVEMKQEVADKISLVLGEMSRWKIADV